MSCTRFSFRTLCTLVVSYLTMAGSALGQLEDTQFEHLSVEQGLSNSSVHAIVQDSLGFIWIGTEEGLNRFDGYSFRTYKHDPRDSASISADEIPRLCVDSRGNLWLSGGRGLDLYDRARDNFKHYVHDPHTLNGLPSNSIFAIAADKHDNIWIGSDSGLTCFAVKRNTFVTFRHDSTNSNSLGAKAIGCIFTEQNGTVWIGHGSGSIDRLERGDDNDPSKLRITRFGNAPTDTSGLSADPVTNINQDLEGNLCVGTFGGGLKRFDSLTNRFLPFAPLDSRHPDAVPRSITSVIPDAKGNLWLGFHNDGLGKYDRGMKSFVRYQPDPHDPYSLNSDRIYALMEDRSGTIWIGTHRGGLNRFDPRKKKFRHIQHLKENENSLSSGVVSTLCEDHSGGIWTGLEDKGLDHFDPATKRYTHYRHDPRNPYSIGSNNLLSIIEDHLGKIWIRTINGLDEFDNATKRFYHHLYDSPFGESRALYEDNKGNIWTGTVDGSFNSLTCLDRTSLKFVRSAFSRVGDELQFIFQDSTDALWYGTFGSGLYRMDPARNHVAHYLNDPSNPATIASTGLYSIACDRAGEIWIGLFGGLDRYNRATDSFEHFTERDGLANNFVKAILADDHGRLWLSTTKGLSRFDPVKRQFTNYGLEDGIQANEFRTGSCFKGKDGKMYFGGVNGYNVFHPDSIRENPIPPPVVLTSFNVFDKAYPLHESISTISDIQLSYAQDVISFEFVALNYTNPEKNRYAYKMEGFDKDWVQSGTRRYAGYTHLDPGEYVFRVKASNNDGVWNETGASVRLSVVPPFWMRWWFRVAAILCVFGSVGWAIRSFEMRKIREQVLRLEREAALERERTRIARDMHDDLGARLTEIRLLSEMTQRDRSDDRILASNLRDISEDAREIVDSFQEIVWSVNPKYDTLDNFADFLTQYASGYIGKAGLRCRLEIPANLPMLKVSAEARHNMMMAVKEALNNTVKHAGASEVNLTLSCDDRRLVVVIHDNGKGFAPEDARRFGNGLVNMRQRLESIAGEIQIRSTPGGGTNVTLSVFLSTPEK